MAPKKEIAEHLSKILKSKSFEKAKSSQELLKYLVEASLEGKDLKEYTIGIDVFNKKYKDGVNDSKVRVAVYNLRQKLNQFYKNEGLNSDLKFVIPKGQYLVNFKTVEPPNQQAKFIFSRKQRFTFTILFFLVLAIALIPVYLSKDKHINNSYFWNAYFEDEKSTIVYLGDHFVFEGPLITNRGGIIRDYQINSEDELDRYFQDHPEKLEQINKVNYTYLTKQSPICLLELSKLFFANNKELELKLASQINLADLSNRNLVFIGSYKTLGMFKNVFYDINPNYQVSNRELKYLNRLTKKWSTLNFVSQQEKTVDYAIVSQIKGPNNNIITFFLSNHDIGNIATVRHYIHNLKEEAKGEPFYFTNLYKVRGLERTALSLDLIQSDTLIVDLNSAVWPE
ncbi:hypothetical protein [Flexithrix dorotheae]|uniref:hypothetical protein n=1 Tax=Flexithrix dorotheae TaxID=70993 RepID=UPI000373E8C2|nr:hypothetical protein [Flexithrix dorotheae]